MGPMQDSEPFPVRIIATGEVGWVMPHYHPDCGHVTCPVRLSNGQWEAHLPGEWKKLATFDDE